MVAVQHDEFGRVKGVERGEDEERYYEESWRQRNEALRERVRELRTVVEEITGTDVLSELLGYPIKINGFTLAGHSFGCATIL